MSTPTAPNARRDGFLNPSPAEVALVRDGIDRLKRANADKLECPTLRQAAGAMTSANPRKGGDL